MSTLITINISFEQDVVFVRQRARQIAELLGFEPQDRTRIATAVSEIARNAFQYAKGGKIEFRVGDESFLSERESFSAYFPLSNSPSLWVLIVDKGPGIRKLKTILEGQYKSTTGMGLGITGSKKLMDKFYIESSADKGTTIVMAKTLPKRTSSTLTPNRISQIVDFLVMKPPQSPLEEIQRQNQELIHALEELSNRQEELIQLNRELEDTNRGVVALYAELDEKAEFLQRANELKTHFLSNMSHEFRTPLNSILSLSGMLLDHLDGELTIEQEKQVIFIRKSAEGLLELVNDLLDLAKVEAGKIIVNSNEFKVSDLFAALRGMLRPLLSHNHSISLVFEEPTDIPTLYTDEGKVAQILRNFISNALKYTERGEVRVKASLLGNSVVFSVADTGIGIAPEDRERIFEEFIQINSPIQKQVRGTGLGLPLSRRLAELLGGSVSVSSELGLGSTFFASIPLVYAGAIDLGSVPKVTWQLDASRVPILVVEDNPETLFTYQKFLEKTNYQIVAARSLKEAKQALQMFKPKAVILDILLEEESSWSFLSEIKENPAKQDIPILVATVVDNEKKARALGADAFFRKPPERLVLLNAINKLIKLDNKHKILIVDDDEVARYVVKELLKFQHFNIIEAPGGRASIQLARNEKPDCIFLDLVMPDMNGFEVVGKLKEDSQTNHIPIIINTSKTLSEEESRYLSPRVVDIISKEGLCREEKSSIVKEALLKAGLVLANL